MVAFILTVDMILLAFSSSIQSINKCWSEHILSTVLMNYRSTRDYFDEKYQIQKYYFEKKLGVDIAPCIPLCRGS